MDRFKSWLRTDSTLKDALDVIISGHTRVAPVFEGDRFVGMLTAEQINSEMQA